MNNLRKKQCENQVVFGAIALAYSVWLCVSFAGRCQTKKEPGGKTSVTPTSGSDNINTTEKFPNGINSSSNSAGTNGTKGYEWVPAIVIDKVIRGDNPGDWYEVRVQPTKAMKDRMNKNGSVNGSAGQNLDKHAEDMVLLTKADHLIVRREENSELDELTGSPGPAPTIDGTDSNDQPEKILSPQGVDPEKKRRDSTDPARYRRSQNFNVDDTVWFKIWNWPPPSPSLPSIRPMESIPDNLTHKPSNPLKTPMARGLLRQKSFSDK